MIISIFFEQTKRQNARSRIIVRGAAAALFAAWAGVCAATDFRPDGGFLRAEAVWPAGRETERNLFVGFQLRFDAKGSVNPRLRFTASSIARVYLNGEVFAYGPARGPHGIDRIDEWKLEGRVRPGENILAFEVAGYNVNSFYLLNEPAYLRAEVVGDNGLVMAATDVSTPARILTERVQKVPRFSCQRPFCEVYALTAHAYDWRTNSFGDRVALARATGSATLESPYPHPRLDLSAPLAPLFAGTLRYDRAHEILRGGGTDGDANPKYGFSPVECTARPMREIQRFVETSRAPLAHARAYPLKDLDYALFDRGFCDTGFLGATIRCSRPGRLYFVFDEVLFKGDVNPARHNWQCLSALTYNFTAPGEYRIEGFEPNTMRYVKILSDGFAGEIEGLRIRAYKHAPTPATFASSDAGLNRIYAAACETFAQNAVDAFTDCPSRERAGWLCDSFFTGRVAQMLTGRTDVERGFLQNYALCPVSHLGGFVPMCYPGDAGLLLNWNFFLILELEEYLQRSGDRALIEQFRPRVLQILTALRQYRNADGLLEKLPGWVFVEWSFSNQLVQDVNYPSNMTYAEVLDVVSRLYGLAACAEEAARVRETVRRQSWNGQWFCDNAIRQKDGTLKLSGECTETCQYYAFFFKTATKELYPDLWQRLVTDFGPERKKDAAKDKWPKIHPSNAFIGNYLRLECLSREGLSAQLLDESKGYFLGMADQSGTLWEHDRTHASLCHGFASHVAIVLYRDVLGLRAIDRERRRVRVAVDPKVALESCEGTVPVVGGVISVAWKKIGGKIDLQVQVPSGWTKEIRE